MGVRLEDGGERAQVEDKPQRPAAAKRLRDGALAQRAAAMVHRVKDDVLVSPTTSHELAFCASTSRQETRSGVKSSKSSNMACRESRRLIRESENREEGREGNAPRRVQESGARQESGAEHRGTSLPHGPPLCALRRSLHYSQRRGSERLTVAVAEEDEAVQAGAAREARRGEAGLGRSAKGHKRRDGARRGITHPRFERARRRYSDSTASPPPRPVESEKLPVVMRPMTWSGEGGSHSCGRRWDQRLVRL